ncbi:MAG: histidine phosphatase family protein [Candidatus Uhrbacteria bacterium]|nr:histidine phosphatase family protein [Candidatus Uhrbacteria bacterium]
MRHGTLVLVRHGESRFNMLNLFTGWIDVPLSVAGIQEAQAAARHCRQFNYDVSFTSYLERAHETLLVILSQQKKIGVFQHERGSRYAMIYNTSSEPRKDILPIITVKDLNERAYGALQGMNKNTAQRLYGKENVYAWRRGYRERPPQGESLRDVFERVITYFVINIHPRILQGETVLIVGHGNTLRAIVKFLEKIDDEKIASIDLPFAHPLIYTCAHNKFARIEGAYTVSRPLR